MAEELDKAEELEKSEETDGEADIYTLIDEDGKEEDFELLDKYEENNTVYVALSSLESKDDSEYVILRVSVDENGENRLDTIDDDDEFDRIADYFDNKFFGEIDYDDEAGSTEEK